MANAEEYDAALTEFESDEIVVDETAEQKASEEEGEYVAPEKAMEIINEKLHYDLMNKSELANFVTELEWMQWLKSEVID